MMAKPSPAARSRSGKPAHPLFRGITCRADDAHPAHALYLISIIFRFMSGLLLLLMVVQVALGLASAVEISFGVLLGEAIRLIVFAGLLWAAGDLSDLFVKSHCDILATRIMVATLASQASRPPTSPASPPPPADADGPRGDERAE